MNIDSLELKADRLSDSFQNPPPVPFLLTLPRERALGDGSEQQRNTTTNTSRSIGDLKAQKKASKKKKSQYLFLLFSNKARITFTGAGQHRAHLKQPVAEENSVGGL